MSQPATEMIPFRQEILICHVLKADPVFSGYTSGPLNTNDHKDSGMFFLVKIPVPYQSDAVGGFSKKCRQETQDSQQKYVDAMLFNRGLYK